MSTVLAVLAVGGIITLACIFAVALGWCLGGVLIRLERR